MIRSKSRGKVNKRRNNRKLRKRQSQGMALRGFLRKNGIRHEEGDRYYVGVESYAIVKEYARRRGMSHLVAKTEWERSWLRVTDARILPCSVATKSLCSIEMPRLMGASSEKHYDIVSAKLPSKNMIRKIIEAIGRWVKGLAREKSD